MIQGVGKEQFIVTLINWMEKIWIDRNLLNGGSKLCN